MGVSGQRHTPAALCPEERTPDIFINGGMQFRNKKKLRCGIPAHFEDWLLPTRPTSIFYSYVLAVSLEQLSCENMTYANKKVNETL
jgi:hypothetical protein